MTPNDPFFASQWHFNLIGDIERVWDDYDGTGVHVVLYDDGIQYDHPDLDANYDTSMHFATGGVTYDAYPQNLNTDGHGTSVAGLIGAEANNGIGGVGIAHGAKMTGVDLFNDLMGEPVAVEHLAFEYGQNFDILSNSWGFTPDFSDYLDLGDAASDTAQLLAAMEVAVTNGRGGLGSVITIAAGNDALNAGGYGGTASNLTMAIAATDEFGSVEAFSNWGPSILISAPAATHTTDITGLGGFDTSDTTVNFGGTSASTPIVSGVVALMLEAAPELGWRDVRTILAVSASQTGAAYGAAAENYEVGEWRANGAENWNGGGISWHMSYGFGMVDAFAAVRMAEVWSEMRGIAQTSANQVQVITSSNDASQTISDGQTSSISLSTAIDIEIEHLHVNVFLTHDDFNTLDAELVAPDGSVVPLMLSAGAPGRQLQLSPSITSLEHTLGVTSLLDMSSAGTWHLNVTDPVPGGSGLLIDFDIDFFGRVASADDIHTYTPDFAALQAADGDRNVIRDVNGGTDWLNYAAFASGVSVRLHLGEIWFDGVLQSTVEPGTEIENVVTGDGRDNLFGNDFANRLLGMRGDDHIRGYSGEDVLEGGDGNDTLRGGGDRDTLLGGDGDDQAYGGRVRDRVEGGYGDDTVDGGRGNDILFGGRGDDLVTGGHGRDYIYGGRGNDTIDGGLSDDHLCGNHGVDVFIFGQDYGVDVVLDFEDDIDVLHLDGAIWGGGLTVAQLLDLANDSGADVLFNFGSGNSLTLAGIDDKLVLLDDIVIF